MKKFGTSEIIAIIAYILKASVHAGILKISA